MNYFCTLFNRYYLSKGLVMLDSLKEKAADPYRIFVLAMDELTVQALKDHNDPSIEVISMADFETPELLSVKSTRSVAEYCWTCTSALLKHCLVHFSLPECTYLDADLLFFNDPSVLLREVKSERKSVLITPHNYTRLYDQSEISGIYCVQFMYFKNNDCGMKVLEDWRNKCLAWCFAKAEDGKLGDQKYLDRWPLEFPDCVHSLKQEGVLAPWNIQKYGLRSEAGILQFSHRGKWDDAIFYHFHSFNFIADGKISFGFYPLGYKSLKFIYNPYRKKLREVEGLLFSRYPMKDVIEVRNRTRFSFVYMAKFRLRMLFWAIFYPWFRLSA